MISIISFISAAIAFVYLGVLGVKDLPELVQVEDKGTVYSTCNRLCNGIPYPNVLNCFWFHILIPISK